MTHTVRTLTALLGRTLLALLGSLLLVAHAPALLGWSSATVISGSMSPRLHIGDVLVTSPVRPDQLTPGQVLLVDDPVRPHQLLSHRLVRIDPDGQLVLRGDANPNEDSTRIPTTAVHGVGRLRVPAIGLPVAWLTHHQYDHVLATTLLLLLALTLVLTDDSPSTPSPTPSATGPRGRHRNRARTA